MRTTVAICTWNRCKLLRQTLERMSELQIPPGIQWELLIVNNNCTDSTDEVITRRAEHLPIRRVFEGKPGLSNARNSAIQHARGDYIVWTDDDVLVGSNWLVAYHDAFLQWPEAVVFGGPIEPWFSEPPPEWLRQILPQISNAYALREFGKDPTPLSVEKGVVPFGANFAVRTKDQVRHLYDTRLGLSPGNLVRGEEAAVINELLTQGGHGWWVPSARVRHYIPPERQTIRYLRGFFFGVAKADALNSREISKGKWLGKPRWLWRAAVEAEIKYRWRRLIGKPTDWITHLQKASSYWGMLGIPLFCPSER
jgi:glycosyltransferase involved in cell wall biosynthesis